MYCTGGISAKSPTGVSRRGFNIGTVSKVVAAVAFTDFQNSLGVYKKVASQASQAVVPISATFSATSATPPKYCMGAEAKVSSINRLYLLGVSDVTT